MLPGHPFEGKTLLNPPASIDYVAGSILFMCALVPPENSVNVTTDKPLCKFSFYSLAIGNSPLILADANQF